MSLKLSPSELSHMWIALTDKVTKAERMLLRCIQLTDITPETRSDAASAYQKLWSAYEEKHQELNKDYPATADNRYPWNTDFQ